MRNIYFSLLVIGLALLIPRFESSASDRRTYVNVAAGSLDRRDTVVSFALPKDLKAGVLRIARRIRPHDLVASGR